MIGTVMSVPVACIGSLGFLLLVPVLAFEGILKLVIL